MTLRPNWYFIGLTGSLWGVMLALIAGLLTAPALQAQRAGQPLPGSWTWPQIITVDVVCLLAFVGIIWKLYGDLRTEVTRDAISRPALLGRREIAWTAVSGVSYYRNGLHIRGSGRRIILTPRAYANGKALVKFIEKRTGHRR
ncbi:MAG: hypothetical protein KC425_25225 [Anaerolineales bacterium]|nr:hypothetical protein [Anaerolineales bacterium]